MDLSLSDISELINDLLEKYNQAKQSENKNEMDDLRNRYLKLKTIKNALLEADLDDQIRKFVEILNNNSKLILETARRVGNTNILLSFNNADTDTENHRENRFIDPLNSGPRRSHPEITPPISLFSNYPKTSSSCSNDFNLLHPVMRRLVTKLQKKLLDENIPLYVFEGYRSPERQNTLYAKRPKVTNAQAWQSYHQYGMAADFVFYEHGNWHWGKSNQHTKWYKRLHQIARELGLERVSWEMPHVQLPGVELTDLRSGAYPPGGDSNWGMHLTEVITSWTQAGNNPDAPPAPNGFSDTERPAIDTTTEVPVIPSQSRRLLSRSDIGNASRFHSQFGGIEWKVKLTRDEKGVIIQNTQAPQRSSGKPITCSKIFSIYGDYISNAAIRFDVPEELIVMTIATEASIYRDVSFTGPKTFRWESHINEYSAGPMQILSSTARDLIERYGLGYDPLEIAPTYSSQPVTPSSHPLYDPELNILLGTLAIKNNINKTGYDPVLVAAAYNSGGIYSTNKNHWHLRSYKDHIDRAVKWFGDVFAV